MRFTIFGGGGFIGAALATWLIERGHDVVVPPRDDVALDGNLGHVVYAIGLTADFRTRPLDAIDAHCCAMLSRLRSNKFDSWLYLSSTRVYGGLAVESVDEETVLHVRPDNDGTFNLSKLTGEAACLALPDPMIRVARVANVYGSGMHDQTFLGMLTADIRAGRRVVIGEGPASSKDYVAIDDVCWLIEQIVLGGHARLYNVASGEPVTHEQIATVLAALPEVTVGFAPGGITRAFPRISMARAIRDFGYNPTRLLDELGPLIEKERRRPLQG